MLLTQNKHKVSAKKTCSLFCCPAVLFQVLAVFSSETFYSRSASYSRDSCSSTVDVQTCLSLDECEEQIALQENTQMFSNLDKNPTAAKCFTQM